MAEATERLLLQVDAATELLRRHLAEGEQPLERFERRADQMAQRVEQSIGDMGKRFGNFAQLADDAATRAQRSFETSFSQVQKLAAQAIKGPTIDGRVNLGAEDIRAGAAAAQDQARAFELIGEAAQRTAARIGDTSEATRLFIQATKASQIEAQQKATALLAEAGALERVEIELLQSADATELFVTKHQRLTQAAAEAERLAASERNAAAETRALASAADMLRAELDPMYLAQQRFNAELDRADALLAAGTITQREYGAATQVARDRLYAHAQAITGTLPGTTELTRGTGGLRSAMQGLSFQAQDTFTQVSMGANVLSVIAIQGGQAAGQFAMLEGKAGNVARVLIGPWGLAGTAALLILGSLTKDMDLFGNKLDDAKKKLEDDAKATDLTAQAKKRFESSLSGVVAALKEQDEALKKTAQSERTSAEQANIAAKTKRDQALAIRQVTAAKLAEALADLDNFSMTGGTTGAAALQNQARSDRVNSLKADLATATKAVTDAERQVNVSRVDLAAEQAQIAIDPIRSVTKLYDDRIKALKDEQREQARLGKVIDAESKQRIQQLETEKKAAVETAQARQRAIRSTGNNNQIGRTIDVSEATRIAASIGGRVTSGVRTRERQEQLYADKLAGRHAGPVAKPGTSDHERGQAIDIAFAPGLTVGKIREAFAKEGVAIRQLLVERDQKVFHVAFGKAAPRGPSQATLDKRTETARKAVLRDDSEYTDQERSARQRLLEATRRTAASEEQRDQLVRDSINAEADATEKKVANQFEAGEITLAQAGHLYSINEATRSQKLQNVKIAAATRTIERKYTAEEDDLQARLSLLRLSEDLATTDAQRREVARQILDAEQALRRKALERVRDTSQGPQEVQRARVQLSRLPDVERAEQEQSVRQNAGPLEQYRQRLHAASDDMRASLEDAAVRGFGALEDAGSRATASAVTNLLHLRGVAGDVIGGVIQDLARLAIQKAIVKAAGNSFFGLLADGGAIADLPGYADGGTPGGQIQGPGTGRSDSILAVLGGGKGAIRVSTGEFIVNELATRENLPLLHAINQRRLPRFADGGALSSPRIPTLRSPSLPDFSAARGGRRDEVEHRVKVDIAPSPLFETTMEQTSYRMVAGAAEPIMAGAEARTRRSLSRPSLPGGSAW